MNTNDQNPGDEKPKKVTKKKTSKKKAVNKKITPKKSTHKPVELTEEVDDFELVSKLLEDSISQYKDVIEQDFKEYKTNMEHLQNITTEYLDDFVIIGHTADDKRVVIRYAPSPRRYDGLKELVREYLMRMIMNDPLEGGPPNESDNPF